MVLVVYVNYVNLVFITCKVQFFKPIHTNIHTIARILLAFRGVYPIFWALFVSRYGSFGLLIDILFVIEKWKKDSIMFLELVDTLTLYKWNYMSIAGIKNTN